MTMSYELKYELSLQSKQTADGKDYWLPPPSPLTRLKYYVTMKSEANIIKIHTPSLHIMQ